jgi:hypothetical protein
VTAIDRGYFNGLKSAGTPAFVGPSVPFPASAVTTPVVKEYDLIRLSTPSLKYNLPSGPTTISLISPIETGIPGRAYGVSKTVDMA